MALRDGMLILIFLDDVMRHVDADAQNGQAEIPKKVNVWRDRT